MEKITIALLLIKSKLQDLQQDRNLSNAIDWLKCLMILVIYGLILERQFNLDPPSEPPIFTSTSPKLKSHFNNFNRLTLLANHPTQKFSRSYETFLIECTHGKRKILLTRLIGFRYTCRPFVKTVLFCQRSLRIYLQRFTRN